MEWVSNTVFMVVPANYNTVMNPLLKRISINPLVCHGRPCIRGTRVWVENILDNLATDETFESILAAYPSLAREDIQAAIAYAAAMVRDRYVDIPLDRPA